MSAPFYAVLGPDGALLAALALGLGFGWFLERGGLGDARKLAAQFYLTDLTVFKVMFAAVVTAMLGLFWLSRLGFLDLGRIYVPETHLIPQAVGGLVFGVGFIMGGLCPGTGCVAASSGRLDGLALMGGMLAGIVVFAEAYPLLAPLDRATDLGRLTLMDVLPLSYGALVFLVVLTALGGFFVAEKIEARRRSE